MKVRLQPWQIKIYRVYFAYNDKFSLSMWIFFLYPSWISHPQSLKQQWIILCGHKEKARSSPGALPLSLLCQESCSINSYMSPLRFLSLNIYRPYSFPTYELSYFTVHIFMNICSFSHCNIKEFNIWNLILIISIVQHYLGRTEILKGYATFHGHIQKL